MGGITAKQATSIVVNNSKSNVQYHLIRREDIKVEEKYEISGKTTLTATEPKVEIGGTYNVTLGTNKEVNSYIIVPPGWESRIGLKSCDHVPVKSRLIIVVGQISQYIELHEGFQAFLVDEEGKLRKCDMEEMVNLYEKKIKEKGYVDTTIKQSVKKQLLEYFNKEELVNLAENQPEFYDRICAIVPALKNR